MFTCQRCGQIYDRASDAMNCATDDANRQYAEELELRRSEDAHNLYERDYAYLYEYREGIEPIEGQDYRTDAGPLADLNLGEKDDAR